MLRGKRAYILLVLAFSLVLRVPEAASTWVTVGDLHDNLIHNTTTLLPDGTVLFAGGLNGYYPDDIHLSDFRGYSIYDPATRDWIRYGDLSLSTNIDFIEASGNLAFALRAKGETSGNYPEENEMQVIDFGQPRQPRIIGSVALPYATGFAVSGAYVYVTSSNPDALIVIDVSVPSDPQIAASLPLPGTQASDVAVSGSHAWIVSDNGSYVGVDISVPTQPFESYSGDTSGTNTSEIYASGNYLYVLASYTDQLIIVDISTPTEPAEISSIWTNNVSDVETAGDYLYMASGNLKVYDISNPATPALVADAFSYHINGFEIIDSYLYAAVYGIMVIDISEPSDPREETEVFAPQEYDDIVVTGGYALALKHFGSGIHTVDFSTPTEPRTLEMDQARAGHTATQLSDGTVLVAGGNTGDARICELYDPATGYWKRTGDMINVRSYGHAAVILEGGRVLVTGGIPSTGCELYDPSTGLWSATRSMATSRGGHTATRLQNGRVLVTGGYSTYGSGGKLDTEIYDPVSGWWDPMPDLNEGRYWHTATLLEDGRVLVAGGEYGATCELFDPAQRTWIFSDDMSSSRTSHTATLLEDGRVLVAGGWSDNGNKNIPLASAEIFDPATESWTVAAAMTTARAKHTAVLLPDGNVLVAGGFGDGGRLASSEVYDIAPPFVTAIVRVDANPTNSSSVAFTVTFKEAVTGVDSEDFDLAGTVTGGSVSDVSGSGNTYTVTVEGYMGLGTLGLVVDDDDSILDIADKPLGGSGLGNGDYSSGEVYDIDREQPTVLSITCADPNPTNAASVNFTVIFSENVTGVDPFDFILPATNTVTGGNVAAVSGADNIYTVTVDSFSGHGILRLDVDDNDSIADALGNPLGGEGTDNGDFTGLYYNIDVEHPTVASITCLDPNPSIAATVNFLVTFSEAVSGVGFNDFIMSPENTIAGGTVLDVSGGGATYIVSVSSYTGAGTLRLDVCDDNSIVDGASNPLGGGDEGDGNFTGGEVYDIDLRATSGITCSLSAVSLILGEPLTISGQISPAPQDAGAFVSIALIPPVDDKVLVSVNANEQGAFTYDITCMDINQAGTWAVRASWNGDAGLKPAVSADETLDVAKAASRVTLDVASQAIKLGDTVSLAGKFTPNPNCGGDLSGLPLTVFISGPHGTDIQNVVTNDQFGHFLLENYDGFDALGDWTVQVFFYGNAAYENAISESVPVRVVETAGYAIVVQGKISTDEGLLSHNKTTNFVYNQLTDRGLLDEDILYFNYDTLQPGVDGLPIEEDIEDAIVTWAADKMNARPANLYIILVDHGLNDDFFIDPDVITSQELDSWLTALQNSLAFHAADQEIIAVLGFCRSGSFIDDLSGLNRVIIASAAADESSYKGPLDEGGIREGEYFISEFIKQVAYGKSVKQCFEEATALTEAFTSSGTGLSGNAPFYDDSFQHPLLDDNGDGAGSNDLSDPGGDGWYSEDLFIGVSSLTGNDPLDVQVIDWADTQFLTSSDSTADLWAVVDDDNRLTAIWVEVKPPGYSPIDPGGSGQAEMDLVKTYGVWDDGIDQQYEWNALGGFDTAGTYQVFYFAKDDISGNVSQLVQTNVYKAIDGNQAPADFVLQEPDHDAAITTEAMLFNWADTTDPDGDAFTYTLYLSKDAGFAEPVAIVKADLSNSACVVSRVEDGLEDLTHYYWKVRAIDEFGAYAQSAVREFDTDFINAIPGWIEGHVYNATQGGAVSGAQLTIGTTQLITDANGYYLGIFLPDTYSSLVSATGFYDKPLDITILEGNLVSKDIGLDFVVTDIPGDINHDGLVLLSDAILALQVMTDMRPPDIYLINDVNADGKIGLQELVFILQRISNIR